MSDERLVWIDTETFGLIPEDHPILEVGFTITDLDLKHIASTEIRLWEPWYQEALDDLMKDGLRGDTDALFVFNMHKASGLWDEAKRDGVTIAAASIQLVKWLVTFGVTKEEPMCGSSVQFDRKMLDYHLPAVHNMFSYRNIDISSVKELCRRYNPRIFADLETDTQPLKRHRTLADIDDTIAEFKFYRDEFLFWQDGKDSA